MGSNLLSLVLEAKLCRYGVNEMWQRSVSRIVGILVLYFVLHAVMAVLHEVFPYDSRVGNMALFPVAKLLGDSLFTVVRSGKLHAFWEEWIIESARFVVLGIFALVCAEFWRATLGLQTMPSLVPVAVIAYLITDWGRKGERPHSELS